MRQRFRRSVLLLVLLASSSLMVMPVGADEGEQEPIQHQEHAEDTPQEDPVPPQQQEEENPPQEEAVVEEEEPPPAVQEESPPVKEEETPPVVEEEPPVEEEEEEEPIDDSLFELDVFECQAPRGERDNRAGRLPPGAVMTLCFRPKNDNNKDAVQLQSIEHLDFVADKRSGPTQAAIRNNEASGPLTRSLCPSVEDPTLCIAATKLNDEFFDKAYNNAVATGAISVHAAGETRRVPFEYEFLTAKQTKPPPVEHDFFDMPNTPLPFPCSNEIRIWMLAALILTLLEFAFSPTDDDDKNTGKKSGSAKEGGGKKKKPKKE
ncbi:expressed unknown protein [Seminavis robusta]|uniref:Uncharacterized protein n=1 Tax=Seminavis robusta TaxID=568900 RepID=A0A9N8HCA1_9STRA|nr:expressed unknown protein [Seminavis robusta]|eukprot:Sro293_g109940.1 n/a (320) ;mRNA; r:44173-45132